jgi:predicted nicotinamide N-methyase
VNRAAPHDLRTRRARLLARIQRKYDTADDVLSIGPLRVPFTRVKDPDVVLDQLAEAADQRERETGERIDLQHLPYWAELWDSAYGVAERLVARSNAWGLGDPKLVLDLGCGMGLTGTVAAQLRASVMLADLEAEALLFAQYNASQTGDAHLVPRHITGRHRRGLQYRNYRRWVPRVRARQINWQTDHLGEQFDLILGADILYDKTQWPFLDAFFREHLAPGGVVILGEPGRATGDLFVNWIVERNWSLDRIEVLVPTRGKPIRIFELH